MQLKTWQSAMMHGLLALGMYGGGVMLIFGGIFLVFAVGIGGANSGVSSAPLEGIIFLAGLGFVAPWVLAALCSVGSIAILRRKHVLQIADTAGFALVSAFCFGAGAFLILWILQTEGRYTIIAVTVSVVFLVTTYLYGKKKAAV